MQSINRIIEACTVGTHALQVMLFGKKGEGDPKCFGAGGLSDDGLSSLVGAHEALMKGACAGEDVGGRVDAIIDSGLSLCDRLPVNAMTTWLAAKAPDASAEAVRAIANLFQVCLEVDRDGTTLSPEILVGGCEIYSPLCLIREDQGFARGRPDQLQQRKRQGQHHTRCTEYFGA